MNQNGYFKLEQKADGVYMHIYPAEEGGEPLQAKEALDYLMLHNIMYDAKKLGDGIEEANSQIKETEVLLNLDQIYPERESYTMTIPEDNMIAVARFYPGMDGTEPITLSEFMGDLKAKNVSFGIDQEALSAFFQDKQYCQDIVVAKGKPPVHGEDARIEYFFDTNRKAKPAVREDGSVDFHELNAINHVNEGDLLARLIPATQGEYGTTIRGLQIKPRDVKKVRLEYGLNIEINEEKTEIRSLVNGHVNLYGKKVFVSNVLELENVDTSTGNIEYEGNVSIHGNVTSGFKVKATGDIQVNGVVEGAELESEGNITIARGMNGMSKGVLNAKGHIVSKFLENCEANAGDYLSTESIMNSKVSAGTEIDVTGKKGFIAGGKVLASKKISVKTLGSKLGASTEVEVGIDPRLKREQAEIRKTLQANQKTIAQIEPVLAALIKKRTIGAEMNAAQMQQMQNLAATRKAKMDENYDIQLRLDELEDMIDLNEDPVIIVQGEVYPGTKITVSDVSMFVKSEISYCRFVREMGDGRMKPL